MTDVIVIGGGPAGITAAATLTQYGVKNLLLEAEKLMATVFGYSWKLIENYPGFENRKAIEIAKAFVEYANQYGVETVYERVVDVVKKDDKFIVKTNGSEYETKAVIIAIGILGKPRRPGLKNEDAVNVHYVITDISPFVGKNVVIIGGGDSAVDTAIALALNGAKVTIVHRRKEFRAPKASVEKMLRLGVKPILEARVKEILAEGDRAVAIRLQTPHGESVLSFDHLIFMIGYEPPDLTWVKRLGIELRGREIIVDAWGGTNVKGIFAAGDITIAPKRILVAAGQGYSSALGVFRYLRAKG